MAVYVHNKRTDAVRPETLAANNCEIEHFHLIFICKVFNGPYLGLVGKMQVNPSPISAKKR